MYSDLLRLLYHILSFQCEYFILMIRRDTMRHLSVMIKPASSLCNMRCRYCFYSNISDMRKVRSFGIMSPETSDAMLANIFADLDDGDVLSLAFQGGEPTLAGLPYFDHIVEKVNSLKGGVEVSYAIQTNGLALDDEWCEFLKRNGFLVGLSFDILPENHDADRIDTTGNGTYKRVASAMKLLESYNVDHNVLCTLTNAAARHPKKVWDRIIGSDIRYIQFTPCLDDLDRPGESVYALTPKRYASFYKDIFDRWYDEFISGRYRSVRLFDDLVNLLAFGEETSCGICGRCEPQLVVEADGGVYPCDFYCLDEYRLGSFTDLSMRELFERSAASPVKIRDELPPLCTECAFKAVCGGGCKRMQREVCCTKDDKYCGYRDFLTYAYPRLMSIAKRERKWQDMQPPC